MIVRIVVMAVVLVLALLVDTVVLSNLGLGVWRPDLVMLTVMAVALAGGAGSGARYGFVAGLLVDLLSTDARLVGTSALVLLLVGYGLGALRPYLADGGIAARVLAVGCASVLAVLVGSVLDQVLEVGSAGLAATAGRALAVGAVHALLTPVVVWPVEALTRRLPTGPGAERAQAVWQGP